jgi:hypothetical protein
MQYKLELVDKNSRYGVFDENNNLIIDYKYKSLAIEHIAALNSGIEFVMKDISHYKYLG